jgi:Protein of unknown function (DUF2892)
MSQFFKTALYARNLPPTERMLRVIAALGVSASIAYLVQAPWLVWTGIASAVTMVITGLVGFCPACYLAGRRVERQQAP